MKTTTYLASKPRYEILDGLRGVAAIIVVAFHLFETDSAGPANQILNHGDLAVAFCFVLSGFVIGYAYDDRWDRMTTWDFFKRRLVRLHPMVIMGTLLGASLFYFSACSAFPMVMQTPWWNVLLMTLLGCLMFPTPTSWDIRGWWETNALNGPTWSLMWEYIANVLYALFIRRFSKLALGIFVGLSACLTLDVTLNIDTFGLLSSRGEAAYTLIGGWSLTPGQLYIGISRLLYPFFMGRLLSRIGKQVKVKRGFYWCSLLVTVILVMPRSGGETSQWMNGVYEAVSVLALFPLIVAMGAVSNVTAKRSVALCKFLGELSYPLYITHFPLIYMQIAWARNNPDAPAGMHLFIAVSVFVLSIAIAYACLKLYDEPVREWLKQHWLMKKNTKTSK